MHTVTRFYCCSSGFPHALKSLLHAWRPLLLCLRLTGCGGEGCSSAPAASAPASTPSVQQDLPEQSRSAAQGAAPATGEPAPSATADTSAVASPEESARLKQISALPLLSPLSDREKAGLLKQLPSASPSDRLTLINGYPKLAALPERQQQVLLDQLETIVPVSVAANLLTCSCANEVKREMCVKESCTNRSELSSMCSRACGTLAAFKSKCVTSKECAGK